VHTVTWLDLVSDSKEAASYKKRKCKHPLLCYVYAHSGRKLVDGSNSWAEGPKIWTS
jgi:hypothetical protein